MTDSAFSLRRVFVPLLAVLLLPPIATRAQTLKASAPLPTSPTSGASLSSRTPALVVQNAVGTYVSAVFVYRFEVYDAERMTLAASGVIGEGSGITQFPITTTLDYATDYWWRARAELERSGPDAMLVDDHSGGGTESEGLDGIAGLGPFHGRFLVATSVEQEREEGRQDDQVDGRILGAHDAEQAEDRVVGPAHGVDLEGDIASATC